MVSLEANVCGLPVITVNHKRNAASYFITDGNGFICKLSEKDVAEKIVMALDKKEDMERRCIENAKRYDWERITESCECYYNQSRRGGDG